MIHSLYVIPGFGFDADVFSLGVLTNFECVKLNYSHLNDSSIDGMARQLADTIPDSAVIVAWSFGGLLAIKIAQLFPAKVTKLILWASQPKLVEDNDYQGIKLSAIDSLLAMAEKDFNQFKIDFVKWVNFPNRVKDYQEHIQNHFVNDSDKLVALLHLMRSVDLRKEYQDLEVKILHIINGKDAILTQNGSCLMALNPNAKVIYIDTAGHTGFLTHVEPYRSAMLDFIYE